MREFFLMSNQHSVSLLNSLLTEEWMCCKRPPPNGSSTPTDLLVLLSPENKLQGQKSKPFTKQMNTNSMCKYKQPHSFAVSRNFERLIMRM